MNKKKLLLFAVFIVILVLCFGLIACNNNNVNNEEEPEEEDQPKETQTVNGYLNRINSNLTSEIEYLSNATNYSVESEVEINTSILNYTIQYKASYAGKATNESTFNDSPNNLYYISMFDNKNHKERIKVYYSGKDLYLTFEGKPYVIRDFSSYLLYNLFAQICDYIDLGEIVYGETVRDVFKGGSAIASAVNVNDFKQINTENKGFALSINNIDLGVLMGRINDYIENQTSDIGNIFDAISVYYLGFKFSALMGIKFSSINVDKISFYVGKIQNSTSTTGVEEINTKVSGRLQDASKYSLSVKYAVLEKQSSIEDGVEYIKGVNFASINLKQGTYDGNILLPTLRESDYKITFDYNLDPQNNANNEFTLRIYDKNVSNTTGKYEGINEFLGVYYKNSVLYCNFEGIFNSIGEILQLSALNLPKIYFTDIDISSIMRQIYTYLYRAVLIMLNKDSNTSITVGKKFKEQLYASVTSDISNVKNPKITLELTEELIKAFLNTEKSLALILGEKLGLDEKTIARTIGVSFFSLTRALISYSFGTKFLDIDVYQGDTKVADASMHRDEYVGVEVPTTANDLYYTEFKKQNNYTFNFEINLTPYEKENVDISRIIGAFVGDVSGKNTQLELEPNQYIVLRGKITERQITQMTFNSEDRIIDVGIYIKENNSGEEKLLVYAATSSDNINDALVELGTDLGDYKLSNSETIKYKIPVESIYECLKELGGEDSIYNVNSTTALLVLLTNSLNDKSKTYAQDGYYCASLKIDEDATGKDGSVVDPGYNLFGIEGCNFIIKMKGDFSSIDLTKYKPSTYSSVKIEGKYENGVSYTSIYQNGSAWDTNVKTFIGERTINLYVQYTEESTKIITNKNTYNPTGKLFGKTITYELKILDASGTYVIKDIDLQTINDTPTLIIDPALTKTLPTRISVIYDNDDTSEENCEIRGFYETNIQYSGFNKQLLDGDTQNLAKYKLIIGENSIAQVEFDIYIAVIDREIIPVTDNGYIGEIPVIGEFSLDPYYYANRLYYDQDYDYIDEILRDSNLAINFENEYKIYETNGKERIDIDEETEEVIIHRYDREGYNYIYLKNVNTEYDFDKTLITYKGGELYAYGYYGDLEYAIRINVIAKVVDYILINNEESGTYTIDYLITSTYDIPSQTDTNNSVKIVFQDEQKVGIESRKIIRGSRPTEVSSEEFYKNYIISMLDWNGVEEMKSKITLDGTYSLFGDNNETYAYFGEYKISGMEDNFTQKVTVKVNQPSRNIDGNDNVKSIYAVYSYNTPFSVSDPERKNVLINKAKFSLNDSEDYGSFHWMEPFAINPYSEQTYLPETIFLYVQRANSSSYEWKEYNISWATTDRNGNELNIIGINSNNRYYLKAPTVEERYINVYGTVGDGAKVWVNMLLLNMKSEVNDVTLYNQDGTVYNYAELNTETGIVSWKEIKTISIDPYVDYISLLPTRFVVTLGSGEIVSGSTQFYFKNNDITYPVDRSYDNSFASSTYNRNYTSNGRYIFLKSGGNYSLTIFVKGQSDLVSNEISININVLPRLLKKDVDESEQLISNYIDIINIGNLVVGDTYPYVSSDEGGYIDINVYDEESTVIVEKLEEILNNDGIGLVGVVFSNVDNYYVRKASFNLSDLETIINALKHNINNVAYTLRGVIDYDNINSQNIVIKFSLNGQKANSLILTYSRNAIANRVYSIRSDVLGNNDGVLTLDEELNKVTESEFIESNRYNKYFGVTTGYNDADYDYVIYFDVVKAYQLYKDNGTMYYVSPYDYFTYVFSRYDIALGSGRRIKVETDFTGNEKEKFNKAFLGLDATMKEDYFTYAFLTLNKLSRGSVEDKVLLIFKCETSTGAGTNVGVGKNISVDVFDENLKEIYTSNYKLPSKAEITFTSDYTNQTYVVAYETQLWTPVEETRIELNVQGDINAIAYEKIDILSNNGTTYNFTYRLPEINVIYSLGIEFSPKNFNEKLFNADSDNELFTIKEGVINVTNPYMFFKFKENGKYAINEEKIPTVIKPIQTRALLTVGEVYSYNVEWVFEDVEFDESILTTTQKFKIASYTFDSYKVNGEGKTQTIYLYVDVSEMVFYSFNNKDEKLTIEETEIDGENAIKNVVTIDPYTYKENGRTGTFTLPTSVSIGFKIEKDGKTIEYKNLYENVRYRLLKYDDNTIDFGSIQSFDFTEKGHMLYSGNSSYDVYLRLLIPGFEGDMKLSTTKAIIIKVKIFQRIIEDVNLPNYKYNTDGSYIYTNTKETLSDGREIKVIDSYYPYATVTEKSNVNDDVNVRKVPIYYIDPYNNDTYELPTVVSLKFEGEDDFVDYSISSWKYYNDDSFSESKDNGAFYHPSALEGGNGYYYSYQSGDYKQNVYRLKASIKIGESTQTFEVFCIVINRELKINTLINDSYKTYFDFADPIAALLKDIPSELNEAMFVDYDKYLANIKVDEYISLAINNSCLFSQNGANNAIIPSLLWEDEYDTDGDSIVDKSFNELIKIGFNGDIYGNIYYNANSLSNEIEYQQMIAMSGFDVYIKAAIWDSFFVNDKVVNDFSAPIINAIETQLKELKKDQIYSTYELLLTTLEREQRATLENSIFTNKLEELNGSRAMAGLPLYDKDIKEDKRDVLFEVYSDLEEEHTNWVNNGSRSTQKTANINIFIEWNKVITEFVMTPEISMYVTMNEVYKAKYIDILKENNAKLAETINEKYAQNKEDIENYIKSTIYENILNNCTDEEYTYLKEIESRIKGTYDKRTKNKLAYDILIVEYYNNKDLGVRGEQTKANITIPIIEFTGKDSIKIDDTHNENGVSINNENGTITFEFSKFDFTSLGAEFKFNFNVTYKEVLKDKVDEAKEEAYIDYIDQYVDEIFEEFIKEEINKGLEEIKPKVINNETGEYEYYNSAIIGNHLENTLVYDNLKSLFNNNELKSNDYLGYFKTLYNNFFTYYQEKSVDVIIKAFNTASISAYEDITIEKIGNISGLNNVYNIIAESLIENDSRYSSVIAAIEGNPENDTAAMRILAIKDYLFENEEHLMLFRQFEGEIKTNLANSIENVLSKVNDTNFRNVLEQYKSQMGFSLSGLFAGYEAAARIAYIGFSGAEKGVILTTLFNFIEYYITNSEYLGIV
ncbi:MAG: hypothetical protein K5765_01430, partial [Clostridia bacterium]|nr:hypothetical protein [Clostridia bacterium]